MQSLPAVTPETLTRQESLALWMRRTTTTFVSLAEGSGVTGAQMGRLCSQDTMPVRHHAHLLAQGVPAELLPRPEDQKPGRKPISRPIPHDLAMAAFRGV
jgi:hypothetical protein